MVALRCATVPMPEFSKRHSKFPDSGSHVLKVSPALVPTPFVLVIVHRAS
jgi:hypothetical protein